MQSGRRRCSKADVLLDNSKFPPMELGPQQWKRSQLCRLFCVLLLAERALSQDAAFQGQLQKNEEALAQGQQAPVDPLESKIIKEAPPAVLTSGVGDVSIFGALTCVFA